MFVFFTITELLAFNLQIFWSHVTMTTPLLPSFGIQWLADTKRRRLNYEPL